MALYSYSLFLLRETARGALVDDLVRAGLATADGGELEFLGMRCTPSVAARPEGITVVELAPGDDAFERVLRERGHELVAWLWRASEACGVLYAFIPGGDDVTYEEQGVDIQRFQWTQLSELLDTGTVRIIHPFMWFAERLGHGRPCAKARTLNWGLNESRPGVGCLVSLAERSETGFEILEPGAMYPQLKAAWA